MKEECQNCNYVTIVKYYANEKYRFCDLCASTYLSRATTESHRLSPETIWLFKSIAVGLNNIMEAVTGNTKFRISGIED